MSLDQGARAYGSKRENADGVIYLDPDFRRNAPTSGPFCARCQKPIADPSTATKVTVDWNTWKVTLGGSDLIGADCWRVISAKRK